ncbi:MAG: lipopolysaccharide biosynthesis protein, partial [Hungatella sp.]
MNTWKQLLLGSDQQIGRRNMIWNMIGSAIYALSSMMIGMAVTRILGADLGGIFFFAFTTFGQQMFIVSYFGMRPIQITDVQEEHSFGEYRR